MKKLAIITTHPVQYYAPVFKLLTERNKLNIKVFYTWGKEVINKYDPGFDKIIEWDIPVLEGYSYEWVKNTSKQPGSHHFKGVVNPQLINQIELWQPDAILIYGWGYQSHLKAIRYFKNKIPVYFRGDSNLLDEKSGVKSLLRLIFLKWIYGHIDHAFYVGANNKAYFKKYGLKENQLTFAPHAIDNKRFSDGKKSEAQLLRKELNIKEENIIVLFAGKLEDKKAPLQLLDAFLNLNNPDVHLLFIGNGPLEKPLKFKAKNKRNIHFLDFRNQSAMPAVYRVCDLFCLPSGGPNETWGLAVNEAMACGKAVLVSDKAGCAVDLVKDHYNGLIFQGNNREELTSCLKNLTASKKVLAEYGAGSLSIIKDWNFEAIAEIIENKLIDEA